jgi:uncharacterized protein YndB with AHSA1/START domain
MSEERRIELEIVVPGTPEEVWEAIATGPGITSWYVPHTVVEEEGGAATASFGPGPEMQIAGRVAAWEPPTRIVFDKGEGVPGLAFEWLIEARDGGSCVVRLVNTGFGSGEEWDAQYDGMVEGWRMFLFNLRMHLEHFRGRTATPILPLGMWEGSPEAGWARLTDLLGLPSDAAVGDRVSSDSANAPAFSGTVVDAALHRLSLLVDEPAPGTAFLVVEGAAGATGVSVWFYLYGDSGASAAARDESRWWSFLAEHGMHPEAEPRAVEKVEDRNTGSSP